MDLTDVPGMVDQAERLIQLGVHELGGLTGEELREAARSIEPGKGRVLAIHPDWVPPSALIPLMVHEDKSGFIVEDLTDLDEFVPIPQVRLPDRPVYGLEGIDRGDAMLNWTPNEALPRILASDRTPLTIGEGACWVLQQPGALERGRCFMTIASRLRKPSGTLDARTPALWISNGTGRDGRENRDAPKAGWCWAGNRHTWLGIASASKRI